MIRPSTYHTASRPVIRPYVRPSSGCIQFDYHLLLMATFNFDLTECKSKATKPDAKFNWKSFYFLVGLIGFLCLNTASGAPAADPLRSSSGNEVGLPDNVLNSKPNRSEIDDRQPDRTKYLVRVENETPADQQLNQTSTAASSTYQIFNDQTSDRSSSINLISFINRNPTQTPGPAGQTSRAESTNPPSYSSNYSLNHSSIDEIGKSCNERYLCLPTNRTIRPTLITTYTAERQDGRVPLETPKNSAFLSNPPTSLSGPTQAELVTSLLRTHEMTSNQATEIESKMRRRFASDNSDQQKGLNEEDSKNYNQKKRDKMQKMQNYEQQVGFFYGSKNF